MENWHWVTSEGRDSREGLLFSLPRSPLPLPALLSTSSLLEAEARAQFSLSPIISPLSLLPPNSPYDIPWYPPPSYPVRPHTAHNNSNKADKIHIIFKKCRKRKMFYGAIEALYYQGLHVVTRPQYFRFSSFIFPYTTYMYMYFQGNERSVWILNCSKKQHANNTKNDSVKCERDFPHNFLILKNERLRSVLSIALYSPQVIYTIGLADSLYGLITQGRRGTPPPHFQKWDTSGVFRPPPPTFGQNNCSTCNFTICSQIVVKTFFF